MIIINIIILYLIYITHTLIISPSMGRFPMATVLIKHAAD